ncbi:uncharacterized protein LOC122861830 isoform X2 [Siniperca chuatsi]|uniref:uncharacterized protein LOC122861830 isoform X2 n=1 Tax=Siniperca chuatsi TaxID=119488 RepID=UPI001CE087B2|nr:uncharacterized protein LOC122861830 isoform X2 [Siniperca chuatsi]
MAARLKLRESQGKAMAPLHPACPSRVIGQKLTSLISKKDAPLSSRTSFFLPQKMRRAFDVFLPQKMRRAFDVFLPQKMRRAFDVFLPQKMRRAFDVFLPQKMRRAFEISSSEDEEGLRRISSSEDEEGLRRISSSEDEEGLRRISSSEDEEDVAADDGDLPEQRRPDSPVLRMPVESSWSTRSSSASQSIDSYPKVALKRKASTGSSSLSVDSSQGCIDAKEKLSSPKKRLENPARTLLCRRFRGRYSEM